MIEHIERASKLTETASRLLLFAEMELQAGTIEVWRYGTLTVQWRGGHPCYYERMRGVRSSWVTRDEAVSIILEVLLEGVPE